tara:strand:- start:3567 stop:5483 length:1917 start_codon:yes stop_codon:yes gene_type:complete
MLDSGLLDEHEGRGQEQTGGDEYVPTPEEKITLKLVEKLFKKSKKWRSNYDKNWLTDYKFFRGQQWESQRPSYRHSEVINKVFQSIQSSVPMLTDSRPKFEFLPQDPSDIQFAEIMNQVAENDWQRNNWSMKLTECVYDAHFYSVGYASMTYDPKAKKGMGDIVFKSEDPFYCFPDPNSKDVNEGSNYFMIAEPVDLDVIKRDYPDLGKYVTADLEDLTGGEKTDLESFYKLKLPNDQTNVMRESAGRADAYFDKKCLKKTVYIHSDEVDEKEILAEDGTATYEQHLKYPNGRKIVAAGGVVLEDGPNQYDDGKFPCARVVNYILPREFFGVNDIEQVKGPQKIFNKLVSFAMDVLTLMGNPVWIVDNDSDVDTDNLINKPGLVIEKNKGSEVRREEGVQLQPYVLQLIGTMAQEYNDASGRTDVSQGITPGQVTAASAIASLQEAAQTRIRLKSRNLDAFLQNLGQMWMSRTLQYRDVPTIIRVTGNQDAARYFQFHIAKVTSLNPTTGQLEPVMDDRGNPLRKAVVRHADPTTGQFGDAQEMMIKGELDVQVSTGSTLPFMKAQKAQDVKDLFTMGLVDQEEVLKTLDWPNYQGLMARMQKKMEQDAMAQAQAAQAEAQVKAGGSQMPLQGPPGPV